MLERLRYFAHIKHSASGKEFSLAQKLSLYMGAQRRSIHCARAQLERVMYDNPTIKLQAWDAIRAISAVEDALETEYKRDREALKLHKMQQDAANIAYEEFTKP